MKRMIALIVSVIALVLLVFGGESSEDGEVYVEQIGSESAYEELNEEVEVHERPSKITSRYIDVDLMYVRSEDTPEGLAIDLHYRVDKVDGTDGGYTFHPDEGHLGLDNGATSLPERKSSLLNTSLADEGMSEGIVSYVFEGTTLDDVEGGTVRLNKEWGSTENSWVAPTADEPWIWEITLDEEQN